MCASLNGSIQRISLVFDCPDFQGLRQQHAEIFRDSHDAMRSVTWHKDQKSVCALVLAIVNEAQTLWQIRPHRPLLAVWT